jgi:Protein of unknown function (DUF3071)
MGLGLQKLYLVGFTSDLRGLVLSRQKGVKSGGFFVELDDHMRSALNGIYRPGNGGSSADPVPAGIVEAPPAPEPEPEPEMSPERPAGEPKARKRPVRSVLTPKEIQAELRSGKTVQEVAQMAGTDASWIERFLSPILAERKGIVDAVVSGFISRPRRGRSSCNVGQAIVANLKERKVSISPEDLQEGWSVARRKGLWEVTFRYSLRGQDKLLQFTYDPEGGVTAVDADASVIGWRPPAAKRAGGAEGGPEAGPAAGPTAAARPTAAAKPKAKSNSAPPRDFAAATAPLWGATKVTPPTAPARRSNFIGVGKAVQGNGTAEKQADGPGPSKLAAKPAAKAAARPKPSPPAPSAPPSPPAPAAPSAPPAPSAPSAPSAPPVLQGQPIPQGHPQGQPAKRLPGAADDRRLFARSSASPRPKRLITLADDEADWRSALAKMRAKRKGVAPGTQPGAPAPQPGPPAARPAAPGPRQAAQPQPPSQAQPPAQPGRPRRKRLPDNWLTGE